MKHPNENDFDVNDEESAVVVIFKPTESYFSFLRLENGEVSTVADVRHAKTGDTDQYIESEIGSLAQTLASQHARRRL